MHDTLADERTDGQTYTRAIAIPSVCTLHAMLMPSRNRSTFFYKQTVNTREKVKVDADITD